MPELLALVRKLLRLTSEQKDYGLL